MVVGEDFESSQISVGCGMKEKWKPNKWPTFLEYLDEKGRSVGKVKTACMFTFVVYFA